MMTLDEAQDILDNVCPCSHPLCPDSVRLHELEQAHSVLRAEDDYVDAQIEAALEARAFGDYDERLEP